MAALLMQDSLQITEQHPSDTSAVRVQHDSSMHAVKKSGIHPAKPDSTTDAVHHRPVNTIVLQKKNPAEPAAPVEKTTQVNLFKNHELKVIHTGPQSLNRVTPDWVFPLFVLVILAFAWLRTFSNKYFSQILTAFFNNNLANQIVRDENILVQRASILLNIVFNLVMALFLYFVSIHFNWPLGGIGTGMNRYIFFALVVSGVYAMKFLLLKICGYLFHLEREMSTYIFNIFLINNLLGMLLIPITAFLAFSVSVGSKWLIYGSLVLVSAAFLYRVVRGFMVGISSPVSSLYYLFLYLCTLEFAPLLVLIKIINPN